MTSNLKLHCAKDRRREIARLQRAARSSATDHILNGKPLNAVFTYVIPFVRDLANFDGRIGQYRIQAARITGSSQRNPFTRQALRGLVQAADQCLEAFNQIALRVQPQAKDRLVLAHALAAKLAINDFACPHYTDRAAWFELSLAEARREFATANRHPRKKPKKRRTRQETDSTIKILAALFLHHQYGKKEPRYDPVDHTALAKMARTSKPSVTRFFKGYFTNYASYVRLCEAQPERLVGKLETLEHRTLRERQLLSEPVA